MASKLPEENNSYDSMTALFELMVDHDSLLNRTKLKNQSIQWIIDRQEISFAFYMTLEDALDRIGNRVRLTFPAQFNTRSVWAANGTILMIQSNKIYVRLDDPSTYKWHGQAPTRVTQGFTIEF